MGIQAADTTISANTQPLLLPIAVKVCPMAIATQSWSWIQFIPSIWTHAEAGMRPMVPIFRSFIDQRGCSQSCMQDAQLRAQWNSVLQCAYPHPYHVKTHTGSITATSTSSMSLLCTPVCSYPIKDSDRAVCYSLATSLLDHSVLSSIRSSSIMWLQSIKSSVGSSERVAGICRSVWSCAPDSMFGPWCDPTSPGEARPSSACAGGYAQNLGRTFGIAIPSSSDSPVTTTASLPLFGVPTHHPSTCDAEGYAENLAGASIPTIPSSFDSPVTTTASLALESTASAKAKSLAITSSFDSLVTTTASLPFLESPPTTPRLATPKAMPKIWQWPPFSQSHQVLTVQ